MIRLLRAYCLAIKAHKGQKDKAGKSYIWHPITVSRSCKKYSAKIVGILHDVLEGSN